MRWMGHVVNRNANWKERDQDLVIDGKINLKQILIYYGGPEPDL